MSTGRLDRARQIRQRRLKGGGDDDESTLELSATTGLACFLLLLSIGASLASSYIMTHNPGCMDGNLFSGMSSSSSSLSMGTTSTTAAGGGGGGGGGGIPASISMDQFLPTLRPGFPPKCTTEDIKQVRSQLPPDKCFDSPTTQMCSFCQATTKGCPDATWYREYYGQKMTIDAPKTFNAIFVGLACTAGSDDTMIDTMAIGSHDVTKFDRTKFAPSADPKNCRTEVPLAAPQGSKFLCIAPVNAASVETAKKNSGLSDKDLQIVPTALSTEKTLDSVLKEVGWEAKPIHILRMAKDDYQVLQGAMGQTLDRVRVLEFQYNNNLSWTSGRLSTLVKKTLADKNFVCYWNGKDGNIWRITDCWQVHYSQQWWAFVTCVNISHDDAKPILEKMELTFQETLKKEGLSFGKED